MSTATTNGNTSSMTRTFTYIALTLAILAGVGISLVMLSQWPEAGYGLLFLVAIGSIATVGVFIRMRLIFPEITPVDGMYSFRTSRLGAILLTMFWLLCTLLSLILLVTVVSMMSELEATSFWVSIAAASFGVITTSHRSIRAWKSRADGVHITRSEIAVMDDKKGSKTYTASEITNLSVFVIRLDREGEHTYGLRINNDEYDLTTLNVNGYAEQLRVVLAEYFPSVYS